MDSLKALCQHYMEVVRELLKCMYKLTIKYALNCEMNGTVMKVAKKVFISWHM